MDLPLQRFSPVFISALLDKGLDNGNGVSVSAGCAPSLRPATVDLVICLDVAFVCLSSTCSIRHRLLCSCCVRGLSASACIYLHPPSAQIIVTNIGR
jgi:hypothetical protein